LIKTANEFAVIINACDSSGKPPAILAQTVGKMQLKGVPGLNIVSNKSQL